MKTFLIAFFSFFIGFLAALFMARYASQLENYIQLSRAREGIMQLAYDDYTNHRYERAASIVEATNLIASYRDEEWGFWMPVWGALNRANGVLQYIHVHPKYNDPLLAYLLRLSGDETAASVYYESVTRDKHKTEAEIDVFAKAYLDRLSAMDRGAVKDFFRD